MTTEGNPLTKALYNLHFLPTSRYSVVLLELELTDDWIYVLNIWSSVQLNYHDSVTRLFLNVTRYRHYKIDLNS